MGKVVEFPAAPAEHKRERGLERIYTDLLNLADKMGVPQQYPEQWPFGIYTLDPNKQPKRKGGAS